MLVDDTIIKETNKINDLFKAAGSVGADFYKGLSGSPFAALLRGAAGDKSLRFLKGGTGMRCMFIIKTDNWRISVDAGDPPGLSLEMDNIKGDPAVLGAKIETMHNIARTLAGSAQALKHFSGQFMGLYEKQHSLINEANGAHKKNQVQIAHQLTNTADICVGFRSFSITTKGAAPVKIERYAIKKITPTFAHINFSYVFTGGDTLINQGDVKVKLPDIPTWLASKKAYYEESDLCDRIKDVKNIKGLFDI